MKLICAWAVAHHVLWCSIMFVGFRSAGFGSHGFGCEITRGSLLDHTRKK